MHSFAWNLAVSAKLESALLYQIAPSEPAADTGQPKLYFLCMGPIAVTS